MARATTKKKTTKQLTFRQKAVRWVFRPMPLTIAAVLSTVWLCWPMVQQKLPTLDDREEYRIGVDQIVISPAPRWVPVDLVQRVFARADFGDSLSLQDPMVSEKIALAFHTHPWIEQLKRVRKSFPAKITVDVVYREPVAMVQVVGGGYLPIDKFGHLLPDEDFSPADIDRYPIIANVTSIPIRRGESWGDAAVVGAAELAAVLTKKNDGEQSWWRALELKAILAPQQVAIGKDAANLQYRLVTAGGSQILWGRSPATRHPAELKVGQKLERMAEYHRSYNGFDAAPAPVVIDIRDWQHTRHSPLAKESSDTSFQ